VKAGFIERIPVAEEVGLLKLPDALPDRSRVCAAIPADWG